MQSLTWICCWRRLILCCCCRSCCCCLAICGEIAQKKCEVCITIPGAGMQDTSTLLGSLNCSIKRRNLQVRVQQPQLPLKQGAHVQEQFIANTSLKGNIMENVVLGIKRRTDAKISPLSLSEMALPKSPKSEHSCAPTCWRKNNTGRETGK